MSILFGHPTGNQGAHQTALAYLNAGLLAAYCVTWMPSARTVRILQHVPGLRPSAARLQRRHA